MSHEDERDRETTPELEAKYDAACRSVTDLHAELMRKKDRIKALEDALQEARDQIPRQIDRTVPKPTHALVPGDDALVRPSWMSITEIEKRSGMIRVYGHTTLSPGEVVTTRPAPGTAASAQWALEFWGEDEDETQ